MALPPDQAELEELWREQGRLAVAGPALAVSILILGALAVFWPRYAGDPGRLAIVLLVVGPVLASVMVTSSGPVYRAIIRRIARR